MIQDLSFDSANIRNAISRYFISQNSNLIKWACDDVDTKLNLQINQMANNHLIIALIWQVTEDKKQNFFNFRKINEPVNIKLMLTSNQIQE